MTIKMAEWGHRKILVQKLRTFKLTLKKPQ